MSNKILFVEDEEDLTLIVADTLRGEGYEVVTAVDGEDGLEKFKTEAADIVVADVMMPKMDGFTMAKEIRKLSPTVPLLFLTAKSTIDDVEQGFEIGANDYLKKPFELRELIVRIKALLRRYGDNRTEDIRFAIGTYIFNVTTQTLSFGDKETELSHFEAKILERLATNIGKTVDASELMIAVWQRDEQSNRNSLHGYIHKLRRALRHDPTISIINQRGFGYMLVVK
ncbi:response regulator transcription factor [Barnesiella sp. WM24]|uniref:response regulator transcription factor n=1 Tax=Barnesiella sp. WM24 TaxID=2558278 RepID=UPI001071CECE|nr:response regulator transcription factor [Barnesiella sp. WM24]TFU94524.1 response regulator transcription factor [Barnesiella sp. WM24]